jgi:pimeloyl-ACP methyl ester carboxylesterase
VKSYGPNGKIAHLVFDLRGTGESDGVLGDQNYELDLNGIEEWAKERFGRINFGFLGFPTVEEYAKVNIWPLRAGAILESYLYRAASSSVSPSSIIYLSGYGNFSRQDEAFCMAIADAGYDVYGVDPLRYLLHANMKKRIRPDLLAEDMRELIQMLPSHPILIGQPLAAGLALTWAVLVQRVRGVIAIGKAQAGLGPRHIFDNDNPFTFELSRHIPKLAPRPVALVIPKSRRSTATAEELKTLFECSKDPRRLEKVDRMTPEFALDLLKWIEESET